MTVTFICEPQPKTNQRLIFSNAKPNQRLVFQTAKTNQRLVSPNHGIHRIPVQVLEWIFALKSMKDLF